MRLILLLWCLLIFRGDAAAWIHAKSLETRFVSYIHADPGGREDANGLVEGRLMLEGRKKISPGREIVLETEVWVDQRSLSAGWVNQLHDRLARRPNFNVVEAYLQAAIGRWDVRLGKEKISWGRSDGLNPTDVLSAFDYADLLEPRRLGIVGIRAFYYPLSNAAAAAEFVVQPWVSPSRSGRFHTRWRPVLEDGTTAVPVDVRFPLAVPASANYAVKISEQAEHTDWSLMYARTVDDVAGSEQVVGSIVKPLFLKKRTVGFDLSRTVDQAQWEVHLEMAHTSTPAGQDDDYTQIVAGGRRSFPDAYRRMDVDLTIEWAGEIVHSRRANPARIGRNLVQRPFPGSILLDASLGVTEFVSCRINGAYTYRGRDAYVVTGEVSWRVSDALDLRTGIDAISGKGRRTPQDLYEENDRWRLEAVFYFGAGPKP